MSFKIEPKAGPHVIKPSTGNSNEVGATARDRAIAKLMGTDSQPKQEAAPSIAQAHPVKNPSNVSPEEMSVVKAPSNPVETQANSEQIEQKTISEGQDKVSEDTKQESSSDQLSPHYASLAKKERALRAKVQELKAKEEALKSKEQEYQSKFISKDELTSDPLSVLNKLGVTYEQLTSLILNQGSPEAATQNAAVQRLEAEIKAIRESQEADRRLAVEQQTQTYQQALNQIKSETKSLITTDPYFEVIREERAVNQVVDLIERTFNEDGVLLSVEEAAKQVEDYLAEKAERVAKLKKIQSKLKGPEPKKSAPVETKQPQQDSKETQPQTKTLTNTMSSSRPLTAKERAILAFKGELNSK